MASKASVTLTRKQAADQANEAKRREVFAFKCVFLTDLQARDWIQRVLGDQLPGEDGDDLKDVLQNGVVCKHEKTTKF